MDNMNDVARRAGVSESAVSHVMNKTGAVSEEKKAQVLLAMREFGFSADAHARGLALGRRNSLGILVSDFENPLFPGAIKSFEDLARKNGFDVLLCCSAPITTLALPNALAGSWWRIWFRQ